MRKVMAGFLLTAMVFTLTACGNSSEAESTASESVTTENSQQETEAVNTEETATEGTTDEEAENNVLIAYFSRTGENYGVGVNEKGNTAIIAEMIAEQTGGELFEIRTVEAYPEDYDETTEIAQQELKENARPELAENLDSLNDVDTIYLGYPIWLAYHNLIQCTQA